MLLYLDKSITVTGKWLLLASSCSDRTRACLNIKMSSYQYRDPHVKNKMVSRPSYLQHGNPYTWERQSLYWDGALVIFITYAEPSTHWGRVTHICVGDLTIIGSDNGLSPGRRQAIIWTNVGLLSIGPLRTYFSENLIKIQQFPLNKMHMKMSSAKWRLSCLGLNVLCLNRNEMHLSINQHCFK